MSSAYLNALREERNPTTLYSEVVRMREQRDEAYAEVARLRSELDAAIAPDGGKGVEAWRRCYTRLRAKNERLWSLANRARDHFLGYVALSFEQEQALANEIGEEVRDE